MDSMSQRLGDNCLTEMHQLDVGPEFNMARRYFEDWKNGKKINRFFASPKYKIAALVKDVPLLRLVLAPMSNGDLSGPGVHFIDNFQLKFHDISGRMELETVSFLLSHDHGIDETYKVFVVNILNKIPVHILGYFGTVRVEEYNLPYPIVENQSQLVVEEMDMKVESCVESEDQYTLSITVRSDQDVFGLHIKSHEEAPCQSFHDLTVSLCQPCEFCDEFVPSKSNNINPLTLSFPFPVMRSTNYGSYHSGCRHLSLVLKKSLHEPWPCDFSPEKHKWIIDDLVPWENGNFESGNKFDCVEAHLTDQFSSMEEIDHTPLYIFRLRLLAMIMSFDFVVYGRNNDRYLLKLHRPLLTSPMGSPILLVTALDVRGLRAIPLTEEQKLGRINVFKRVFSSETELVKTFEAETEEEFQLFRSILRINSTRIEPSKWQKEI